MLRWLAGGAFTEIVMSRSPFLFEDPTLECLARIVNDLLPETTRFTDTRTESGAPALRIDWTISPFSRRQAKVALELVFADGSLARYAASPSKEQARAEAILRAYVEAVIGSMEERYADGDDVEPVTIVELGRVFA